MATVRESLSVRASVVKTWESVLDFESRPKFTPIVTEVTYLDGKPLKVGSRIRLGIGNDRFTSVVQSIDPPKRLELLVKGPGFMAFHSYEVASSGEGSRVAMSANYGGPLGVVFARLMKKSVRKDLLRELAALKHAAEWIDP